MVYLNSVISVITFNINSANKPFKRQSVILGKNQDPRCSKKIYFKYKETNRFKVKR